MSYLLTSLAQDPSIKRALKKALSDDGKLSFEEIKAITRSSLDGTGVSLQEFKDLQTILKNAKSIDQRSRNLIDNFITLNYRPTPSPAAGKILTPHFSLSEFACKDGTPVPSRLIQNVKKLALNLEVLRNAFGIPIKINSGYRHDSYNKSIGGASKSQHLVAKAADIRIKGVTSKNVKAKIEELINDNKMEQGGIGLYNSFVHYDVRGGKARW
ncbi:MAG: DUF882 domain-containing protein [Cocleimonas sp.]|nr:DUF882 domain-containing protein [Cocleimonas sp.]